MVKGNFHLLQSENLKVTVMGNKTKLSKYKESAIYIGLMNKCSF